VKITGDLLASPILQLSSLIFAQEMFSDFAPPVKMIESSKSTYFYPIVPIITSFQVCRQTINYDSCNSWIFICCTPCWQLNRSGAGSGGTVAKDALGNDVIASEWLNTHGPGDRTLTQGLKVFPLLFIYFYSLYIIIDHIYL
jgi:hypothetical protein